MRREHARWGEAAAWVIVGLILANLIWGGGLDGFLSWQTAVGFGIVAASYPLLAPLVLGSAWLWERVPRTLF